MILALRGVDVAHADQHRVFRGNLGAKPKMFVSGSGPSPRSAASGMPCTLPEGEVSGVLMSECASIQTRPIFCSCRR